MLAGECEVGCLLALWRYAKPVGAEPDLELIDQVEIRVFGLAHGRVVALTLAVILAPGHMDCDGAEEALDTVSSVEVEPEVTNLESHW